MDTLLLISVIALGGLLMFGLKFLRTFVEAKTEGIQDARLREATELLSGLALNAAEAVAQGAVNDLKAAAADGKLSRAEAKAAADKAKRLAFSQLSNDVQRLLIVQAGSPEEALERFVAPKLEGAVQKVKDARGRYERALKELGPNGPAFGRSSLPVERRLPSEADVKRARDFLGL